MNEISRAEAVSEIAPDWVRHHNAQKEKDATTAQERARRSLEAGMLYLAKGPEVWQRFVKELARQAVALEKLDGEELFGSTTPMGNPGGPMSCQVNVERRSVSRGPKLSRIVFHYDAAGAHLIRVASYNAAESTLRFQIGPDDNIGFAYRGRFLSPERMAETVIRQMADGAREG
jgi:hypothetical protein